MMLSVCLSFAYIGTKTRTERPRKTKLGTEVLPTSHVTRTPLSRSKDQRSRSPGRFAHRRWRVRRLQRWACERVGRGKLLLCCRLLGGARRPRGRGAGHIVAARLQHVIIIILRLDPMSVDS